MLICRKTTNQSINLGVLRVQVICVQDVTTTYRVPLLLEEQKVVEVNCVSTQSAAAHAPAEEVSHEVAETWQTGALLY